MGLAIISSLTRVEEKETKERSVMLVMVAVTVAAVAQAQPSLKVILPEGAAHPHQPYRLVLEVSWPGDPGAYAVLPATFAPVDWGAVNLGEAESVSRDGISVVSQAVSIVPDETGDYKTPEILIAYRNPEDLTPPEATAPATNPAGPSVDPTLRAAPFILHVRPDRTLAWVSGGLGALLLCLMLGWWLAHRRRLPAEHPPSAPDTAQSPPEELLLEARRHRLDGQSYEFYLSLAQALHVCPAEPQLLSHLQRRAQEVGYQGVRPSEDEMTGDYEAVRRALERR